MVTVIQWRDIASGLPEVTEKSAWGAESYRIRGKIFTGLSDEEVVGVAVDRAERTALLASEPQKFFLRENHDENYNWMRVRLPAIDTEELRELLIDAWLLRAPKRLAATHRITLLPGEPT